VLVICQNRENHSPGVCICLHWRWSSLYCQSGFYGKNVKIYIHTGKIVSFSCKNQRLFLLHFSQTSLTNLLYSTLYSFLWAFQQRHGNQISAFSFAEIFAAVKTISMLCSPHLFFWRLTTVCQWHLHWTQDAHCLDWSRGRTNDYFVSLPGSTSFHNLW